MPPIKSGLIITGVLICVIIIAWRFLIVLGREAAVISERAAYEENDWEWFNSSTTNKTL